MGEPLCLRDEGGHTESMVSRMVVERRGADTTLQLRHHVGPITGRARDGELHLGNQDLLRLADYAARNGFTLSSISLSDSDLYPLPPDEQAEISSDLIDLYRRFGLGELMAALREDYDGIYAIGISIINNNSGRRMNIRRRGFVETSVTRDAEHFLANALKDLNLS